MKKILSIGLVIISFSDVCAKQDNSSSSPLVRSITLTPGYMERTFNSNEMMLHGPLGLMQLSTKGFDAAMNAVDHRGAKWVVGLVWLLPHAVLSFSNNLVYHEFGHARAIASKGQDYVYSAALEENIPTDYAYGIYAQKIVNPSKLFDGAHTSGRGAFSLSFVPKAFFKRVVPANLVSNNVDKLTRWWRNPETVKKEDLSYSESWVVDRMQDERKYPLISMVPLDAKYTSLEIQEVMRKIYAKEELSRKETWAEILLSGNFNLYSNATGLNNQMRYAQEVANLIFRNNGHLLYAVDYVDGKVSALGYVMYYNSELSENKINGGNDIANILRAYKARGFSVDEFDIQIGSAASLLLSSTTWAFVYSAVTELPKGSFLVHAPVWQGWRLPDLNFYVTTQGLSFEIVTGYQFNENWYAGLNAEMVYKGNTAYEVAPSVGYKFNTSWGLFGFSGQILISNEMEFGGSAGADWTSLNQSWSVGLKYIYHNALTLMGERNIPFLCAGLMSGGEPSTTNHEVNMTVSYNY